MRSAHQVGEPWYVKKITKHKYEFNMDFRAPRGFIQLSDDVLDFGRGYPGFIIVEPNIKGTVSSRNKDWGFAKWQSLVDRLDLPWAQFDYGEDILDGVTVIKTESFLHGVAVLSVSRGLVATDGGLHHAAAALDVMAVVIWGGYSPPSVLGYDDHVNLAYEDLDCLGTKAPSEACRLAMKRITVEQVATACEIFV